MPVDFSVVVRPDFSVFEVHLRVHACSKQHSAVFLYYLTEGFYGDLHGFFKVCGRFEWGVSFDFHNVKLHFFSKCKLGKFNEVYDPPTIALDDFVGDWQNFQIFVDQRVFVFWSEDF